MFAMRPVFFADHRDIYDALYSSKLRVSAEFMHDFLRARGIILSMHSTREELVEAIAAYAYESSDLDELCDQLEIHSKADKVTNKSFDATISREEVNAALEIIKKNREFKHERFDFDYDSDRIAISVDYYEFDEGRTALRQMRPKKGKIEFIKTGSKTRIRFPGGERISNLTNEIIEEISKRRGDIKVFELNLGAFSKLQRTKFFQLMIAKLDGYKPVDVKKVNLNQEIYTPNFSEDPLMDDELDESEEEDLEEESIAKGNQSKKTIEAEVKSFLKRATLDGSGILHARELHRFLESGFFISRIVWEAKPRSSRNGKPKAELEAILENPAEGKGFKYTVRGVYSHKTNTLYATTKRKPKDVEREELLDLLEKAAQAAYDEVAAEIEAQMLAA